jgi:tetratricopeptide (TPR) repeat protein
VRNLYRDLLPAIRADARIPAEHRETIVRALERLRVDPWFLGALKCYVEDADIAPMPLIRERVVDTVRHAGDLPAEAVADIVVGTIERKVNRAKRTDREAAYHEIRTSGQRTRVAVAEARDELSGQAARYHGDLKAMMQRLLDRSAPQDEAAAATTSVGQSDGATDPESALAALAASDPGAGAAVSNLWNITGPEGLAAAVEAGAEPLAAAGAALWEVAGRLLAEHGRWLPAERAYIEAVDRGDPDPIRQLTRASGCAAARGDAERSAELLEGARQRPGADAHPAMALREVEGIDDPTAVLERLNTVQPSNARERALVHTLCGRTHLREGDYATASRDANEALAVDENDIAAREVRGRAALGVSRDRLIAGERPDIRVVGAALEDLAAVREWLRQRGRHQESGHVTAALAEAHYVGYDPACARAALTAPELREDERLAAGAELAQIAMTIGEHALAHDLLDGIGGVDARLFRASAAARSEDATEALRAAGQLAELLTEGGPEHRRYAAFSLLAAAAHHVAVEWSEAAEAIVAEDAPTIAAVLRSDYHRTRGDLREAENALLPRSADPDALHALVLLAERQDDLTTAVQRAEALVRIDSDPRVKLVLARLLAAHGRVADAVAQLTAVARDQANSGPLRSAAFDRVATLLASRHEFSELARTTDEWQKALSDDPSAPWWRALALARLSRHDEAVEIWRSGALSVEQIEQALLVAEILYRGADGPTAVREISQLSEQFARADERLEFLVLASAIRYGDPLPEDLAERVRQGVQSFPEEFPDSLLFRAEKAPTTAEEFDEFARQYAPASGVAEEFHDKVLAGGVPVTALAAAANKDLGTIWSALRWLPLGYSDEQLDAIERADAAEAIGRPAVWDPASLFVAGGLGTSLRDAITNALPGSVIANSTLEDADHGASAVMGDGATGTIHYDAATGHAVMADIPAEEAERARLRGRGMLALAKTIETIPDHTPEAAGDPWNDALARGDLHDEFMSWPATLAVARRTGLPIYSDDRSIRLSARQDGLRAFGTLALLDTLVDRGLLDGHARADARRVLLASGAEGVRPTLDELVDIAKQADWEPNQVLAAAFPDASAWRKDRLNAWHRAADFLAAVHDRRPDQFREWVARVLAAVDAGAPDIAAAQRVHSLLVCAWDVLQYPPGNTDVFFQALVRTVRDLPFWLRPWPPVDIPLFTMYSTLQIAGHHGSDLQSVLFWRMSRRLALIDAARAADLFIESPYRRTGSWQPPRRPKPPGRRRRRRRHRR